jgi:spermidine synthase
MYIIYVGIFLIALTTLLLELILIRVFDVILYQNMAYMIITCALFAFGLAGVYATLKPVKNFENAHRYISKLALLFGVFAIIIFPAMNLIPFDFEKFGSQPFIQAVSFIGMYIFLVLPFLFSGLIFATIFSVYASKIQSIYFWDLTGAAIGCIIIIPFIPVIGPGGLLFIVFALCIIASGLFSKNKKWLLISVLAGIMISTFPFLKNGYFLFYEHTDKRGVREARTEGRVELTIWDPVSKIDVIKSKDRNTKHVAYDGGSQSSIIYPFDGDFKRLRSILPDSVYNHFWNTGVIASHYFKKDQNQKVLIIGSAAGQEVKAALTYGASEVDGVEMVKAVVNVCFNEYAEYNGKIFYNPKVNIFVDEGRRFLSGSNKKYDIIQIFSNHTTSSIASGSGALATNYLQTSEAYMEYFTHLSNNGILHVNHHVYPKIITTAALAWKNLGRTDFQKHIVVFERKEYKDYLPTILIKMTPWDENELRVLENLFYAKTNTEWVYALVENPINPQKSFLSSQFYTGNFPKELSEIVPFRVEPATDDEPYFSFLRKKLERLEPNKKSYVDYSTASLLNAQLTRRKSIPMDVIHLIVPGVISLFAAFLFIVVPLKFSVTGKSTLWVKKNIILMYFSCLGAGFIILELIFIQIFMKLIGKPLYNYSTVLFVLLFAAGLGSMISEKWKLNSGRKWVIPFVGIFLIGTIILFVHQPVFELFLSSSLLIRIFVTSVLIFPLGFFLGMPFPLGILQIEKHPKGTVAWAWGMNGLFTVIGGLLSVIFSVLLGFKVTILIALIIYLMATFMLYRIKKTS